MASFGQQVDVEVERQKNSIVDDVAAVINAVVNTSEAKVLDAISKISTDPDPDPDPPPSTAFQPMLQFMSQVHTLDDMKEFMDHGWTGGWHSFTTQTGDLENWLQDVDQSGRLARVSLSPSWFNNQGGLSALGRRGVANLNNYQNRIQGVEIEGVPSIEFKAYESLAANLQRPEVVCAYQGKGKHVTDQASYLWYPRYQHDGEVGKGKETKLDLPTYPVYLQQSRNCKRTMNSMPKKGVTTGAMWLQVSGSPLVGNWEESNRDRYFIQATRTDIHYQLLCAHISNCNAVAWFTNGSRRYPNQNMPTYAPSLYNDLIHVISRYEAQEMIDMWGSVYQDSPTVIAK